MSENGTIAATARMMIGRIAPSRSRLMRASPFFGTAGFSTVISWNRNNKKL